MGEVSIKKNTVAEKASDIISVFLMLALVLITFFVYKIFITGNNKEYLSATLELLKMINSFLAIISVISCSILYKKTKKNTVFTLILVYIGLVIGIITDQFDYFTFISNEFYISDYINRQQNENQVFRFLLKLLHRQKTLFFGIYQLFPVNPFIPPPLILSVV